MRHSKEVIIDEMTFTIQHFTATKGSENLLKLGKMMGPTIGQIYEASTKSKEDQIKAVIFAISELCKNNPAAEVTQFIKDCLQVVFYQGQPLMMQYETFFQGKLFLSYKIFAQVIQWNYADFLEGLRAASPGLAVAPE